MQVAGHLEGTASYIDKNGASTGTGTTGTDGLVVIEGINPASLTTVSAPHAAATACVVDLAYIAGTGKITLGAGAVTVVNGRTQ